MSLLKKFPTQIENVVVYQRKPIRDDRGYFERLFCQEELQEVGFQNTIRQINFSSTNKKGIVRGLHMQLSPSLEAKIVSCLKGEVFDVAVDFRKSSPTYLKFHCEILSEKNRKSLVIPEGCAHGFQTLSELSELVYLHTADYSPEDEYGINAVDDILNIPWPLPVCERSDRDQQLPFIKINNNLP